MAPGIPAPKDAQRHSATAGGSEGPARKGPQSAEAGLIILFVIIVGGMALTTLLRFADLVVTAGPNSVGEAGKVYFAHRFQIGESVFGYGNEPPYYPSIHGPLLHSSVGLVGRILDCNVTDLYYVGRSISIASTLLGLMMAGLILRTLRVSWSWLPVVIVTFFAAESVVSHSISYRSDNWIFGLSMIACYLLLAFPNKRWALVVLALLPVVAFFLKATGISILGAIALVFCMDRRWKSGALVGLGSVAVLAATVLLVERLSDGSFVGSFRSGLTMPFSPTYFLSCLALPQIWLPLFLPFALLGRAIPVQRDELQRKRCVVTAFWLVSLLAGALTAMRAGSDAYYFIEPYAYGIILSVAWYADRVKAVDTPAKPGFFLARCAVMVFILSHLPPLLHTVMMPPAGFSTKEPTHLREDRRVIAERVNSQGLKCFSDDPGLNVLLDTPAIIHPLIPTLMIESGTLQISALVGPIERREYDIVVLTGMRWRYEGTAYLPEPFFDALKEHYEQTETGTHYELFVPRTGG